MTVYLFTNIHASTGLSDHKNTIPKYEHQGVKNEDRCWDTEWKIREERKWEWRNKKEVIKNKNNCLKLKIQLHLWI